MKAVIPNLLRYSAAIAALNVMTLQASPLPHTRISRSRPARVTGSPAATLMNINAIAAWYESDGSSEHDPGFMNTGGVTFPRGTGKAIYASGFVIAGKVNDGGKPSRRVIGQSYYSATAPGWIISKGVAADPSDPAVRLYRIRPDYATADLRQDASEYFSMPVDSVTQPEMDSIRHQYAADWSEWPWQKGAPFYDANNNGVLDSGESPGLGGASQVIWYVVNDLDSVQSHSFAGSDPIGLEAQVTLWGYSSPPELSNVIFKKWTLIYKGALSTPAGATIDSAYIGLWSDPDVGDYSDDNAGCDTTLGLGFAYNGEPIDPVYQSFGLAPPAVGYALLEGPLVNSPGDTGYYKWRRVSGKRNLPMTSWIYHFSGGSEIDPTFDSNGAGEWYNWLRGLHSFSGEPYVFPGDSAPTKFWASGDPVAGTGELDAAINQPGDRRMLSATGPFSMAFGDTVEIVAALVGGSGTDRFQSITLMRDNATAARAKFVSLNSGVAGVREGGSTAPRTFSLSQNYPNPFNSTTRIDFTLPGAGRATLDVYDVLGRKVRSLFDRKEKGGEGSAWFDAGILASGVYLYRLNAGGATLVRRMMYIK